MALKEFQKQHSFLGDIPIQEHDSKTFQLHKENYENVCNSFITKNTEKSHYRDICVKLVANLHDLSTNTKGNKHSNCVHFIYWLYDDYIFSKFTSTEINALYDSLIEKFQKNFDKADCNYEELYNDKLEKENIMKLYTFFQNVNSIVKIMDDPRDEKYDKCCEYVRDCFNFYKHKFASRCSNSAQSNTLCNEFSSFVVHYGTLHEHLLKKKKDIPSLKDASTSEFKCIKQAETGNKATKGLKLLGRVAEGMGINVEETSKYISGFRDAISGDGVGPNGQIKTYVRRAIDNSGIFDTSDPVVNEVINAMFTIIPFLFFLYKYSHLSCNNFFKYQYTPIGTWVIEFFALGDIMSDIRP
ncbi:PIR Superfamily Protein [Plasmodium ovale curtisi]|uniref:PIR Superfamily Protein n=1 Tax=Plasmodium ovale curtisi TaxID=864141 RepID=A0A1A8X9A2_PLAOA|nr:PIR Superfamily Protein [Plasmodium ovale curtisi]